MMKKVYDKPHQDNNLRTKDITEIFLTKREQEILTYISEGASNTEIAEKLSISFKTVEGYKTKLLAKTKTKNSAHLVMYAAMHRLIEI